MTLNRLSRHHGRKELYDKATLTSEEMALVEDVLIAAVDAIGASAEKETTDPNVALMMYERSRCSEKVLKAICTRYRLSTELVLGRARLK